MKIHRDNKDVSDFSVQGESLSIVTPDRKLIPCNNKRNKTPNSLFIRKELIGDIANPRKWSKEDIVTDVEKDCLHKTPTYFWHKVD